MSQKVPVAVLAATGAVGQRFVSLLADHPWFEVAAVTASERSAGRRYAEATNWVVPGDIPTRTADLIVQNTDGAGTFTDDIRLVFSALPSDVAREVEPGLAAAGYIVCSNASAYRMEPDVPLLIPEVNADHLALVEAQQTRRGWPGFIVTSPNCAASALMLPLKALHDAFGVTQVHAVTMQAISGAGYPGVASLDILDNVIPFIKGEEPKVETEPRKMLGTLENGTVRLADITISAQTHRVPVFDGHMAALSFGLASTPDLEAVREALAGFEAPEVARGLPSAPERPLIVRDEVDRPQTRRDRDAGNGMAATVGRLQSCPVLGYKLVALAHNTLRGAAGGAILNAELIVAEGYLGDPQTYTTGTVKARPGS